MQAYDPSHDWFHGKSCQPLTKPQYPKLISLEISSAFL
jgi:hypothetical protein